MINFFIACIPPRVSHHHKRIVRIGGFSRLADRPELVAAKMTLESLLLPYQPARPLTGAVSLVLDFTWPWKASDTKRVRVGCRIPHDTKPDWDNAAKTITDRLVTLRFLEQDSRIVDGRVRKWRGDVPGIGVQLRAVGDSE